MLNGTFLPTDKTLHNESVDMLMDVDLNSEVEEFYDSVDETVLELISELEVIPIDNLGELDVSNHSFQPENFFPDPQVHNTKTPSSSNKDASHKDMLSANTIQESSHYPDFSLVTDEEAMKYITEQGKGKRTKSNAETFPKKLHKIVERSEIDGYSDIICWLPHGRAFRIHDTKRFISDILSKYFYLSQFASFKRQLNIYSFRKIVLDGHDRGAYYHELFLRGRPGLCEGICRYKSLSSSFASEPNFCTMSPVKYRSVVQNTNHLRHINIIANPIHPRAVQYCESNSEKNFRATRLSHSISAPNLNTSPQGQKVNEEVLVLNFPSQNNRNPVKTCEFRKRTRVLRNVPGANSTICHITLAEVLDFENIFVKR